VGKAVPEKKGFWPRVATVLVVLLSALVIAGVPGARLVPLVIERVAPPLPDEIRDRDASIEVVARAPDGVLLAGVTVRAVAILEGRAHLAGEGVTDAAGKVILSRLPRAEHWITAELDGRARASTAVALSSGQRRIEMLLASEHRLVVEVKDEKGKPVGGAEIEVAGKDPLPLGARTDPAGNANVRRLGAGPYLVVVRAAGLEEVTQHGVIEGSVARVVLRHLGVIVAHVVDAAGAPAPNAQVQIAGAMLWPARASAANDAGVVRIAALPAGTYAMRAVRGDELSPIEFDVAIKGSEEKEMTLHLERGQTVAVRISEGEAGAPTAGSLENKAISGAHVSLAEGGISPFPLEGVSDRDGRVRLGPVLRGPSTVSARADGFVARGGIPIPEPLPKELAINLARAGTLTGHVVDKRGFAVDGATIEVVGTDFYGAPIDDDPRRSRFREAHFASALGGPALLVSAGELGVVPGPVPPIPRSFDPPSPIPGAAHSLEEPWVTRNDGTFRASPVSPGRVRALVRHPQFVEAISDVVTISSGGQAHVEVVMQAGGSLEGVVVDAGGRPVAGARVLLAATRGAMEHTARTASDGTFAFASVPELVTISVTTDDDLSAVRARVTVLIPDGTRKAITVTLAAPRLPMPVVVKDDRGYPVDAAQLSVSSLDPSSPLRATVYTNARGEASIDGAQGISLRIEVFSPRHAPSAITVEPSATSIAITLGRAETARGEVRSTRGEPIADAEVVLYTELGAKRAKTDAAGLFSIAGLAAGPARMRVRAAGFAPAFRDLAIDPREGTGPVTLARVELPREGIVQGTVVDERGDPVQGARIARDRAPTYLAAGPIPPGLAISDAHGRFRLTELPEGSLAFEAFAADVGRGRAEGVRVVAGRSTDDTRITVKRDAEAAPELPTSGGVAVTLGETNADEVVLVAVSEASAAERAGLAPGDIVLEIDSHVVRTIAEARRSLNGPISDDVIVKLRRAEKALTLRVPREQVRR
jgi:protocatechuate 3,4-dioxygenase beta subunit